MNPEERCPKCRMSSRPRRYIVNERLVMLVCPICGAFWRYEQR